MVLGQQGKLDDAGACFQRVLLTQPTDADAHNNLGLIRARQGRLDEAIANYQQALLLRPDFKVARDNLNRALQQNTSSPAPVSQSAPGLLQMAQAANQQGVAFAQQGRFGEAIASLQTALRYWPNDADAYCNLGTVLGLQGKDDEAKAHYLQALRVKPDHVESHYNLGNGYLKLGQRDLAEASFREALRLAPNHVDAHLNLAVTYIEQKRLDEATVQCHEVQRLKPNHPDACVNLGNINLQRGNLDEAANYYQQALRYQPDSTAAFTNLGNLRRQQGQFHQALACYDKVLHFDPNHVEARFNRAMILLLLGDWEKGWEEYEWRWQTGDFPRYAFGRPRWDGSPLGGRSILLYSEQGLGDTIQFIRYVPLVKERGGRVIVQGHAPLLELLKSMPGIDHLLPGGERPPDFDVHAPLLSLPAIFRDPLDMVPATVPYLHADDKLVEKWRRELAPLNGKKIGIAWQGRPTHRGDKQRSIPLTKFTQLGKLPGVHLISLQKGHGAEQVRNLAGKFPVVDLESRLGDESESFASIAAVMMNLDLVICCDTAIAHLAGALGMPVWVALPLDPDWRWLLEREDSPWYPTVRLFRQQRMGDWETVLERMATALRGMQNT